MLGDEVIWSGGVMFGDVLVALVDINYILKGRGTTKFCLIRYIDETLHIYSQVSMQYKKKCFQIFPSSFFKLVEFEKPQKITA